MMRCVCLSVFVPWDMCVRARACCALVCVCVCDGHPSHFLPASWSRRFCNLGIVCVCVCVCVCACACACLSVCLPVCLYVCAPLIIFYARCVVSPAPPGCTHTHIPRYKNRQTNASHHGNQSGSSGPEVPFARSPERRCPTSSRPTSVHATNTSIRNGNFKSSPL